MLRSLEEGGKLYPGGTSLEIEDAKGVICVWFVLRRPPNLLLSMCLVQGIGENCTAVRVWTKPRVPLWIWIPLVGIGETLTVPHTTGCVRVYILRHLLHNLPYCFSHTFIDCLLIKWPFKVYGYANVSHMKKGMISVLTVCSHPGISVNVLMLSLEHKLVIFTFYLIYI